MSGGLDRRIAALSEAVELADGRLDRDRVESARRIVARAGQRLGLSLDATVVALSGPTGAGKSTLFNALAGRELSTVSARRPTTAAASAAVWGEAHERLLDWLDVRRRHHMGDAASRGLVLLDLPDFDSVEANHRLEVERLLELVDLVVWVVDPQKYADAALHDRYLVPLARLARNMVVVLNQADLLAPGEVAACQADLDGLLRREGLDGVRVLPLSARSGEGVEELRRAIDRRVMDRRAAVERLSADVTAAAAELGASCGGSAAGIGRSERNRLAAALADAAGLPVVVRAVAGAHRRRGALAAGWPFLRWLRKLRPDPLRRLRLDDGPRPGVHTSLPAATPVHRAQVSAAARTLAAAASVGLPTPWPALARAAATASEGEVAERLDRAVAGADLRMRPPRWWRAAGFLQALLAAVALAGAAWLVVLAALGFLRLEDAVPMPEAAGLPLPTLLLAGGALAGALLAALARLVNAAGARRRARRAAAAIRGRVEQVAEDSVIAPLEAELSARERLCAAVRAAAG